ncbi:15461_t:CDS:2, partial [Dentiscutata erythropus]
IKKLSTNENGSNELNNIDNEAAEQELNKVIKKDDFAIMEFKATSQKEINNAFTFTRLNTEGIKKLSTNENGSNELNNIDNEAVEQELNRVIKNDDFAIMEFKTTSQKEMNNAFTFTRLNTKKLSTDENGSNELNNIDNEAAEQEQNRVIKNDDFAIMEFKAISQKEMNNAFKPFHSTFTRLNTEGIKKLSTNENGSNELNNIDNEAAEQELNRVIKKDDFAIMEIVGQFNLGFIIAKLYKDNGCDLLIIDQHASDEKYNFEQLQLHTKIDSQRLISPRYLELTAAQELVAIDNIDILKANGFDIEVDLEAQPTKKLKLISQPMSKDIIFGVEDLEELIFLLTERPGEMIRCSKVRKMFASRACRKSVMVGDALSFQQMEKIVRHMGEIDQPWNCPHGRPTMRHLFDLSQIQSYPSYSMRQRTNRSRLHNL